MFAVAFVVVAVLRDSCVVLALTFAWDACSVVLLTAKTLHAAALFADSFARSSVLCAVFFALFTDVVLAVLVALLAVLVVVLVVLPVVLAVPLVALAAMELEIASDAAAASWDCLSASTALENCSLALLHAEAAAACAAP